ncbi:NUDIX domain-containing protein [Tessaracoccus bendigoensis DSM 12906]|uniref:NUDIX domain-containing protein n=2 Tax=Tessaracoccus TaxID=72763 RepID=A0A1M6HKF4_9ACTN|nr:NUDIX domain-containing protein [Tessaracoccus bendigoensis DSM 12906]
MTPGPVFDPLIEALSARPTRRIADEERTPRGERAAAVLMLFTDTPDPALTFVTRAETLRRHAGQIALPGGRVDPGDLGRADTALREANEEIGLLRSGVAIFGELPPLWVPASGYDVTTVLAAWDGHQRLHPVDPAETGAVHQYPVSQLASNEVRVTGRHPSGFRGPAFALGDQFIWGLTALLVDWVLELAGWRQPWDEDRIVDVPKRFMRD